MTPGNTDSYVVGLYGSWGSGKTSIINLLIQELKKPADKGSAKKSERTSDKNSPIVIKYEPWSYLSGEHLVLDFINTVSREINGIADTKKTLVKIGEAFLQFASEYSSISVVRDAARFASDKLTEYEGSNDIRSSKKNISYEMKLLGQKLVIFIDNLDRLSREEICEFFRLIKNVMDFSNTIFVLAFDYDVVAGALCGYQGASGEEYLAKIIQIPMVIPGIMQEELIDQLLSDCEERLDVKLDDDSVLFNVRYYYLLPFVSTSRDAARYLNTLTFRYSLLKENAPVYYIMAATAVEVFDPLFYKWICNEIVGMKGPAELLEKPEDFDRRFREAFGNPQDSDSEEMESHTYMRRKEQLSLIPGHNSNSLISTSLETHDLPYYEIAKLVFSSYLPSTTLPNEKYNRILEEAKRGEVPYTLLKAVAENGQYQSFLERIKQDAHKLGAKQRECLILALLTVLGAADESGYFNEDAILHNLTGTCIRCWSGFSSNKILELLKTALSATDAIGIVAFRHLLIGLSSHHDESPQGPAQINNDTHLTNDDFNEFVTLYLDKLVNAFAIPEALRSSQILYALGFLSDRDSTRYKEAVHSLIKSNLGKCIYAAHLVDLRTIYQWSGPVGSSPQVKVVMPRGDIPEIDIAPDALNDAIEDAADTGSIVSTSHDILYGCAAFSLAVKSAEANVDVCEVTYTDVINLVDFWRQSTMVNYD